MSFRVSFRVHIFCARLTSKSQYLMVLWNEICYTFNEHPEEVCEVTVVQQDDQRYAGGRLGLQRHLWIRYQPNHVGFVIGVK
jgi:hypothetical protein